MRAAAARSTSTRVALHEESINADLRAIANAVIDSAAGFENVTQGRSRRRVNGNETRATRSPETERYGGALCVGRGPSAPPISRFVNAR
jgi:hypothetical protein